MPCFERCAQTLTRVCGSESPNIFRMAYTWCFRVAFVQLLHRATQPDAVICLGCVIKGDTDHDKYINAAVSQAIMRLGLKYRKPFVFGVLTPNTLTQAQDRAGGKHGNGTEAAVAAIQMVALCQHAARFTNAMRNSLLPLTNNCAKQPKKWAEQ